MRQSSSYRKGGIVALIASVLLTLLSTNSASATVGLGTLFDPTHINEIDLTIPTDSQTSLSDPSTAKNYVAATFSIDFGTQTMGPLNVGIRLKGSTSLEMLNQHPSFKVAFNWSTNKGNRFLGLKNLTLNAMTQDGSKLHEFGTYKLFNAMGVPASRTGWAKLNINGVSRGLYVSIESIDDIFTNNHYLDITNHLYEAIALNDLKPGNADGLKNTGHYLVKEGWSARSNKDDLAKLITVANTSNLASWWTKLATVSNRSELVKFWAIENFVGDWDSYSGPIINNHFLRSNSQGKFTMIPWGTDQTWGENRQTQVLGDDYFFPMDKPQVGFPWVQQAFHKTVMDRGLLFRKCLAYAPCKHEYLLDLKATSAKATSIKIVNAFKAAAIVIGNYSDVAVKQEQVRTENWVAKQQARVATLLKQNHL